MSSRAGSRLPRTAPAQLHPRHHLPSLPFPSRPVGHLLLQGPQWRGRDHLVVSVLQDGPGLLKLLVQKPQAPSPGPV